MRRRHQCAAPRPAIGAGLFHAAFGCYAANCALGLVAAARTGGLRWRWMHHALYITTITLTAAALSTVMWGRPRATLRNAAAALLPAAVPLTVIALVGTGGVKHPMIALSAAPFFVAGATTAGGRARRPKGSRPRRRTRGTI